MTRSLNYPERKHPVTKLATAKSHSAAIAQLQPMNPQKDQPGSGSGSSKKSPIPYDGTTNSPLTYFQFHWDEVVQSANAVETAEKRQSISPTVWLSAGFVATTVVSGLLIGDGLKPTPPLSTKILPLKPRQRAAFLVPRPTPATPEKLQAPRVVPQSPRESQPQAVLPSIAVPNDVPRQPSNQATAQSMAPMLPSVMLAAAPETLTVSRSATPKRIVTGAPAPAGMKPLVRPAYQDLPDLQRPPQTPLTALNTAPAAIRETIPAGIAAPERINSEQPALPAPTPVNPVEPAATLREPPPLPSAQLSAESSATSASDKNQTTEPKPSLAEPGIPATEPPPLSSTPSAIESPLPNGAIKTR